VNSVPNFYGADLPDELVEANPHNIDPRVFDGYRQWAHGNRDSHPREFIEQEYSDKEKAYLLPTRTPADD